VTAAPGLVVTAPDCARISDRASPAATARTGP